MEETNTCSSWRTRDIGPHVRRVHCCRPAGHPGLHGTRADGQTGIVWSQESLSLPDFGAMVG